ncbi:MAG TPA: caspase family protein [Gammaproteobacteria bacterium]
MNITLIKFIGVALLLLAGIQPAGAARYALLVGVGDYHVKPLAGPVNDVHQMEKVLSERWGFDKKNIAILLNKQGTKNNILAAIEKLYQRSQPGDEVFIYLSGHGTSASDKELSTPLPTTSGAFIPIDIADVKTMDELVKKLVIGKNDLRPLLNKFDEGQRHVFVAIDACYSGNTVRGAFGKKRLQKRFIDVRDILPKRAFGDEVGFSGGGEWGGTESGADNHYPYKNVYYLSASGEHEPAQDIPPNMVDVFPTIDGKSHGAFSDTLLKILNKDIDADVNGDGVVSYSELKQVVRDKMRVRGFDHTPQGLPSLAEDTGNLASRSIFGDGLPAQAAAGKDDNTKVNSKKIENTKLAAASPATAAVTPNSGQASSGKPPAHNTSTGKTSATAKPASTQKINPAGATALPLRIDKQLKEVAQRAGEIPAVTLVNDEPMLDVRKDGADVLFVSKSGDLIARLEKPTVNQIVEHIRHQAWAHQLVAAPFKQDFNVGLELYGSGKGSTALEGELLGFSVQSSEKAYILLIDIDPHGTVNVLYPYEPAELGPVEANQLLAFKDLSRVTAPFGRDYVQVYAFKEITEDFKALRGKSFSLGSPYVKNLERLIGSPNMPKARVSMELVTSKAN